MKIFEITQEEKDNADVDLTPDPVTRYNRTNQDTAMIAVPDKIKDDPAAQAAPRVQKGFELPPFHPWNLLHGDPSGEESHIKQWQPDVPKGKPVPKVTAT